MTLRTRENRPWWASHQCRRRQRAAPFVEMSFAIGAWIRDRLPSARGEDHLDGVWSDLKRGESPIHASSAFMPLRAAAFSPPPCAARMVLSPFKNAGTNCGAMEGPDKRAIDPPADHRGCAFPSMAQRGAKRAG
ncbi:MAG: hypothetical protein AAGM38_17370, partial [Pseudomonadota bacterium]